MRILFILLLFTSMVLYARNPVVTVDPSGTRLKTYNEYIKANPLSPLIVRTVSETKAGKANADMLVIVNQGIYPSITDALSVYQIDLNKEGYNVTIITVQGGSPEQLKDTIKQRDPDYVFMVGNIPVAWYEMDEFFGYDKPAWVEFPIDLFFMDLNGNWVDADNNGKYDGHTGAVEPDIDFGRVVAHNMTLPWQGTEQATEAQLLNNYFAKNHAFRTHNTVYLNHSLDWIDDDWVPYANEWDNNVGEAYSQRTLVYNTNETIKTDYVQRIRESTNNRYEHMLFCCHSSPTAHAITYNSSYQWFYNNEIMDINVELAFYNLFCCSNARFVESNYMAGWYMLQRDYGLLSVGSTKTGAMLQFGDFYKPLGQGNTFGTSFKDWATKNMETGAGSQQISRSWFYGMTVIGDPTLKVGRFFSNLPADKASGIIPDIKFSISPNPVRNEAVFKFKAGKSGLTEVLIYDIRGIQKYREADYVSHPGNQTRIWKTGSTMPGYYIAVIKLDGNIIEKGRFIVIK